MASPTRAILTTGNIMTAGASVIRTPTLSKSNTELISSLLESLRSSPTPLSTTPSQNGVLYLPALSVNALTEDRSEYDITVKLFHLPHVPTARMASYTSSALDLVLSTLGVSSVDLLITSFPSISFDADDSAPSPPSQVNSWISVYRVLESLHDAGKIIRLGISEFGTTRLEQLLPLTRVKPSVDQINVRDCCVVPKPLIVYAKEKGIELLTHNDCTDILPAETLRTEVLAKEVEGIADGGKEVVPQWVVKYTAVVRSRGVVENKGYIVMAEIQ